MRTFTLAAALLTAFLAGGAQPTLAQSSGPEKQAPSTASQAKSGLLSEQDLEAKLKNEGYTAIGMIKLRGDVYEARAYNKDGHSVAIEVDARSGKVISEGPSPRT